MPYLLLEESLPACAPSHEEIVASNALTFLSSSGLNSSRLPVQKSKELSYSELDCTRFLLQESKSPLNNSKNSSRSSSDSMKSFKNSMKGDFFLGFDPVSHNFSDLDDDGLHGDRMRPLSSLENNCEMRSRFSMPQFSKKRGSNSPANSKVLAAARVGRRARRKAMLYCSDNKENLFLAHRKEMQETDPKHKGVKRKNARHEGNVRFLVLKRKISTLSSWRTTASVPRITPSILNVADNAFISNFEEMQKFAKSPQTAISSARQAAHSLHGAPNGVEHRQEKKIVVQESAPCQTQIIAPPCSNLACLQSSGLGLPSTDSREESSCSSRADTAGEEQPSFTKGDNFTGFPCTKPPTYPKATQSILTIHNKKCSNHLVVDASCSRETGVAEFHDQVSMNEAQHSSPNSMEMQCEYAKVEEAYEDLAGCESSFCIDAVMNMDNVGFSVPHSMESSAGTGSCDPQMETCKLKLSDHAQTHAGQNLSMANGKRSDHPRLSSDKVLLLTQPLCFENVPTVSNPGDVVELTEVKKETSSQDSAELNLQVFNLNCELLPRHLPASTREHIKGLARKHPPLLHHARDLQSQHQNQKPNDHPRAWGQTLYRHNQHNNMGLPHKFRRGRPPRKSNLCPCPEPKEHADKFAQICAPSGVFGKLNPGIITRLRDKKQVHAVLEAVIRGAFMTSMKENLKLQGAREAAGADAYQGVHGGQRYKAAGCRERTVMKESEGTSDQEFDLKPGLADQKRKAAPHLRGEYETQRHPLNRVEVVGLPGKQNTSLGPLEVRKQEQCLPEEHAVTYANLLKGGSRLTSETYSRDTTMDIKEVSELDQNQVFSVEASGDQKLLKNYSSNAATIAETAKGNVASCWLELLRLDIKGRLSALKRSRRRVRGVIVSGPFDASKERANPVDEMEKWRAFFVHMDNVLCSEGTRLESWMNQITQMQTSYCQMKSDMPG